MHSENYFARLLYPLKKRWYIVLLCILAAFAAANQYLMIATPEYQANATIKIADPQEGAASNNLFRDFDVFKNNAKVETEVEVLKSRHLFSKALQTLDFYVEYYHTGDLKTEEVYNNVPFRVDFNITDSSFYKQHFKLNYTGGNTYSLSYDVNGYTRKVTGTFNKPIKDRGVSLTIHKDENIARYQTEQYLKEPWSFTVYSQEALTSKLHNKDYIVKLVDKDVNIIRIYFTSPIPEKASKMVNAIAEAYIQLGLEEKQDIAASTISFIDQQLEQVGSELTKARDAIKNYRVENGIVNINQSTEATYKTLGELEIQKVELNMQLSVLENLADYLRRNREVPVSPEYNTVLDPLFNDNLSKLNARYRERNELLRTYTEEDNRIKNTDADISRLKVALLEGVNNTRRKLFIRQDELLSEINIQRSSFDGVPEKESTLQELNRSYYLYEKVYNFLIEKRTEAMITRQVTMTFNKVIEPAIVPLEAGSPRRDVIWGLALFLGTVTGVVLAYLRHYMRPLIESPSDIIPNSSIPVAGHIRKMRKNEDAAVEFNTLAMRIIMNRPQDEHMVITVTSTRKGEGKTFVATNLARSFAAMDKKVLLVDLNTYAPKLGEMFDVRELAGIREVYTHQAALQDVIRLTPMPNLDIISAGQDDQEMNHLLATNRTHDIIAELKHQYDVVIIDTPEVGEFIDAIPFMKWSDLNLYVVRAENDRIALVANAEIVKADYRLEEVQFVVNRMKQKRNHTGYLRPSPGSNRKLPVKVPQFLNMFTW